jgi:serine protease Do
MRTLVGSLAILLAAQAAAQAPDFTIPVREASAAVVNLSASLRPVSADLPLAGEDDARDLLWRYFERAPEPRSLGTGFVIDPAGYIITNAHLVANGEEITVRLADRRELEARVIGYDPPSDIALIKIEAGGLTPVRVGDPRALRAGEWVAAIGSPFGLERSVTAGIVSAVGRVLPEANFVAFIQTDAAVNPGSSGGPLLNMRGEVVGVNSGFYSETGGYAGVSFAIPIDVAMDIARQLRAHGKVTRGLIGVRLQEVTTELARAFGLARPAGALVLEVSKGAAAERAAIRPGDVIVRFDGKPVESDAELVQLTAAAAPGKTVEVEFVRFGAQLTARVRVDAARTPDMPPAVKRDEPLGLQALPLSARQRERLRLEGGLVVDQPGNAARRAGLERGDIILSVSGRSVATMAEFSRAVESAGPGATVALLVQREGMRQFLALRLPR